MIIAMILLQQYPHNPLIRMHSLFQQAQELHFFSGINTHTRKHENVGMTDIGRDGRAHTFRRTYGSVLMRVFLLKLRRMNAVRTCSNPNCGNTESKPGNCILSSTHLS